MDGPTPTACVDEYDRQCRARFTAFSPRRPSRAGCHALPARPGRRMRVLFVLNSMSQIYSGIGRSIRELAVRMTDRVALEFAIDDFVPRNVDLLVGFGDKHGFPVHVGPSRHDPDFYTPFNDDLPALFGQGRWDAIELVSWANASSNLTAMECAGGDAVLVYTPHYQPLWTVPMAPEHAAQVESVHRRLVRRADVVFCDSPWERDVLQAVAPRRRNCEFLSLGCDFEAFQPGPPDRSPRLLFVGDLREPRKRFDRVLAVFTRLNRLRPDLRLVVVGNGRDGVADRIPEAIRPACDLLGYIDEPALRRAYAESRGLFLLSDFEAFGLPVVEALASGTPVFLARQAATESLFGHVPGIHICPADDPDATAAVVARTLAREDSVAEVIAARESFRTTFDWSHLALEKWEALAGAWFRRFQSTGWHHPARWATIAPLR